MSTSEIPDHLGDLLDRPLYGALGTVGRDDAVNVSPMWFEFDGDSIRFTHTTRRAKYRNLQRNPSMILAVFDPDKPSRYIEVRGQLAEVRPTRPVRSISDSVAGTARRTLRRHRTAMIASCFVGR